MKPGTRDFARRHAVIGFHTSFWRTRGPALVVPKVLRPHFVRAARGSVIRQDMGRRDVAGSTPVSRMFVTRDGEDYREVMQVGITVAWSCVETQHTERVSTKNQQILPPG